MVARKLSAATLFPGKLFHRQTGTGEQCPPQQEFFDSLKYTSSSRHQWRTKHLLFRKTAIKNTPQLLARYLFGAPSGTRTQDPLIKSQLLYQPANTISRKFNLNVDKIKMAMAFMSLRINLFIQNNKTKLIVISLTQLCKLLFHHKKHLFNFLLEFWLITEYGIKYQSF